MKKWAGKNILLCPACNKPYEYCHGEFKSPYFRHKEKELCEDKFSESETEEHIQGKRDLFEWIKTQDGVTEAILEGWIPETHQRPDIMFKHGDKQYVIEYQCSPIASEYVERHELYQAAGIIDIWILGTEKYLNEVNQKFKQNRREKVIEGFTDYFYDSKNKILITCNCDSVLISIPVERYINYDELCVAIKQYKICKIFDKYDLSCLDLDITSFSNGNILIKQTIIEELTFKFEMLNKKIDLKTNNLLKKITKRIDNLNIYCVLNKTKTHAFLEYKFQFYSGSSNCKKFSISLVYRVFCNDWLLNGCNKPLSFDQLENKIFYDLNNKVEFIESYKDSDYEILKKEKIEKYQDFFKEFKDKKIRLLNGGHIYSQQSIKFKFLKGFKITEEYMLNIFINELKFLKSKGVSEYIFMIPKYNSYYNNLGFYKYIKVGYFDNCIIQHFKNFGFTDVEYLWNSKECD